MTFTESEVYEYYTKRIPDLKWVNRGEVRCPCPIHSGTRDSFAIQAGTGFSRCFSQCGKGWDMVSFEQEISGLDFVRAKEQVFELIGRPKVPWGERDVVAIYEYFDIAGKLLYQVLRYVGKKFRQRKPDGMGGWIWNLKDVKRVPFRLQDLSKADFVVIVEGEKDVLTVERLGLTATCNSGGAEHFCEDLVPYFLGKHVAILPDNDETGRNHALKVASLLSGVVKSLKIVELPQIPQKGDVTDWVSNGGTIENLRELYRKSQTWTPEFEFAVDIPDENDKFVHDLKTEIEISGGLTGFWDLSKLSGLETPWPKLSRSMGGGFRKGEMYVIGANQGAGKTSLVLRFIIAAIRRTEGCVLFSMEMGWKEVFQRMASIEARINLNELREAQFVLRRRSATSAEQAEARTAITPMISSLARVTAELSELPLLVSTKSSVSPEYIAEETFRLSKKLPIRLVVVDHMQLMSSTGSTKGDYEKFTSISRMLKQTAMEIDTPVLIVSQTSRAQAKEHRGELQVSDLRGTGAIEEDAAGVLLLYEDHEDKKLAMAEGDGSRYTRGPVKCVLRLGKNRYGEQDRCFELRHYKTCTRFEMEGA